MLFAECLHCTIGGMPCTFPILCNVTCCSALTQEYRRVAHMFCLIYPTLPDSIRLLSDTYPTPIRHPSDTHPTPIRHLSDVLSDAWALRTPQACYVLKAHTYPTLYPTPIRRGIRRLSDTYPTPIRHLSDAYPTPIRHLSDTYPMPIPHPSDTRTTHFPTQPAPPIAHLKQVYFLAHSQTTCSASQGKSGSATACKQMSTETWIHNCFHGNGRRLHMSACTELTTLHTCRE